MATTYTPKFKEVFSKLELDVKEGRIAKGDVPKEFRRVMRELGTEERMNNLYRIKDKLSGKFAQYKQNKSQLKFHRLKAEQKSFKNEILKCRQVGFSTDSCIYALDKALFEYWSTGLMAHKQVTVKLIFEIVKNAYDYFVKDWGQFYQPQEDSDNANRLSWTDTKASLTVAFDFQGLTVRFLHVSEAAFIDTARLTNSLQAVPVTGEIILESTPNGRGGFFFNVWQDWKEFGMNAAYKGFFVPWFEHYPELPDLYQATPDFVPTPDEEKMIEAYQLEPHHILWRREQIRVTCDNDSDVFDVQYPSNDVDCFLAGSNCVFSKQLLSHQEIFSREPAFRGELRGSGKKFELDLSSKGSLKVYRKPEVGKSYVLGVDSSSGTGHDPSVICVLDGLSGEQVAVQRGFFEPDALADEVYKLSIWYNKAYVNPEANNHGLSVILNLKHRNIPMYRRQEFDSVSKKFKSQLGFYTTSQSKLTMLDNLVRSLKEGRITIHDKDTLNEMSTFVQVFTKHADGRVVATSAREALPGCYDDCVIALALAAEMMRSRAGSLQPQPNQPPQRTNEFVDPDTGFLTYGSSSSIYEDLY